MAVIEFKTNAWKTPEAADNYHKATASDQQIFFKLIRHDLYLKYLYRHISPGQKILDLGCGSGLIATALHDEGYEVVGCDVSEGMLSRFRAEMGTRKIELRKGDGFSIPAADGEFDAVVSRMFIQHFPNWREILREKARATKAGGIVYFDFGNQEHLDLAPGVESPELQYPYNRDPADQMRHYAASSSAEMQRVAAELDLELLEVRPHGFLLLNAQFWRASGSAAAAAFTERLNQHLRKPGALEVLAFIEEEFVSKLPPHATYGSIVVLRKKAPFAAGLRLRDRIAMSRVGGAVRHVRRWLAAKLDGGS